MSIAVVACLIPTFGITVSFLVYQLHKRKFKHEIFMYYNKEYSRINVCTLKSESNESELPIESFRDYLNLTAEEYYWYKLGLVDETVWNCWKNGAKALYKSSSGFKIYVDGENSDDYYNANFLNVLKGRE